jgi:HD-GYP domain-containing protein (c-di-GMP phosphodiesterase class II)
METGPTNNQTGQSLIATLRALSLILDLANGLRENKSIATALFAHALAQRLGLSLQLQADTFFSALLRHIGTTACAHQESAFVEDDVVLRRELSTSDLEDKARIIKAFTTANESKPGTLRTIPDLSQLEEIAKESCGGASVLAKGIGFGTAVTTSLEEMHERFDGKGLPRGLIGEAISLVGRLSSVAHLALSYSSMVGRDVALDVLTNATKRIGALDPVIAKFAHEILHQYPDVWLSRADEGLETILEKLLPFAPQVNELSVASVFGDFGDLQSIHTRGHSHGVATLVRTCASQLGISNSAKNDLLIAAHLHDIGAVAVPTRIWERKTNWSDAERERARMHTYYTERTLFLAPPFLRAAPIAGAHHERLDGTGYHRGVANERIAMSARILAVADIYHALREERPYRSALTKDHAKDTLRRLVRDGALDSTVVDCVTATPNPKKVYAVKHSTLTERELDVLRHVALGRTNKEIAVVLGISARTVQTHTLHVYEKLGVDTRAGAAILAARSGLLEPS